MMTSYAPMEAHPLFYLSLILFAVGALIGIFVFFGTMVIAKAEKTYEGSVSLVTFGGITAAVIAVFTIRSDAIILVPTLLWSLGFIAEIDALAYRLIWWGFGHSSQQINVSAQIAIWYAIAAIVFGVKPTSEKVSRMAFLMYILFLQLAIVHHLLVDPGMSSEFKMFNTSYAMYLAVMTSMVHGLTRYPDPSKLHNAPRDTTRASLSGCVAPPGGTRLFQACLFRSLALAFSAASRVW